MSWTKEQLDSARAMSAEDVLSLCQKYEELEAKVESLTAANGAYLVTHAKLNAKVKKYEALLRKVLDWNESCYGPADHDWPDHAMEILQSLPDQEALSDSGKEGA